MYEKSIQYDRTTRDYACYLGGELVGFERTYHAAEVYLDQLVFELLNTPHALPAVVEEATPACSQPNNLCDVHNPCPAHAADAARYLTEQAAFVPSTCCFCHKPHNPQSCNEMHALLFAPLAVGV